MKKNYLKPETAVVSVVVKNFILGGSSIIPGGGSGEAGEDELGAGRHRGEWGNVWSK